MYFMATVVLSALILAVASEVAKRSGVRRADRLALPHIAT